MTVADLIVHLQRLPPDLAVIIPGEGEGFTDIHSVVLDRAWSAKEDCEVCLAYPDDPKGRLVVRLLHENSITGPPRAWPLPPA